MKNTYYITNSDLKPLTRLSDRTYKRIVAEIYRDDFRGRLHGSESNFLKYYAYLGWTSLSYKNLKMAFQQTKKPSIDHLFPVDFWILFKEGKYLDYCIHPDNVFVIDNDSNTKKGTDIPCLKSNNQHVIVIANSIGIDSLELTNDLYLYDTNFKEFIKLCHFNNIINNTGHALQKMENATHDFNEFI